MKKMVLAALLVASTGLAFAQNVNISREELGSGSPELKGLENAQRWDNDIFHAPQYMPGFPTAATLWPRIVDVRCDKTATGLNCDGYHWTPDLGRGEYLMIHPIIREPAPVVTNTTTIIEKVPFLVEVPVKKKGE